MSKQISLADLDKALEQLPEEGSIPTPELAALARVILKHPKAFAQWLEPQTGIPVFRSKHVEVDSGPRSNAVCFLHRLLCRLGFHRWTPPASGWRRRNPHFPSCEWPETCARCGSRRNVYGPI